MAEKDQLKRQKNLEKLMQLKISLFKYTNKLPKIVDNRPPIKEELKYDPLHSDYDDDQEMLDQ